jgi:uncharacterized protein (DUF2147 family)
MWALISLCTLMFLFPGCAQGQRTETDSHISAESTPVGRWKTIDDVTGKVNSIVVIWEENGTLDGEIEKLVDPKPRDPNPRCLRCDGEMKDKPLIGLRILWNLRKDADQWSGGKILDPDTGKVYRCDIALEDGGKKLRVHGFIGFSLLGRTQYWLRDQ